MDSLLLDIIDTLRAGEVVDEARLISIIRKHNKNLSSGEHFSKRMLLPYYLKMKNEEPARWKLWAIDEGTESKLLRVLRMKPRRTASGVATITVITKPWPCTSDCLYCPNDVRMPKSYLSDEPACQRAERNYFDPYLQVTARLRVLKLMGHATDKIELIILGGTFSDYPVDYQIWFVTELFRALNDADAEHNALIRGAFYKEQGLTYDEEKLAALVAKHQQAIDGGTLTYNQAVRELYQDSEIWRGIAQEQTGSLEELARQQTINETAPHRVVGLVVETRPDAVSVESLNLIRRLGATKVQMGIQSLDPEVLALNNRHTTIAHLSEAFELLRIFGFKIHVHVMRNLYGSTARKDKQEYVSLVTDERYLPDEAKLYPCVLVKGTGLEKHFEDGSWQPYLEDELIDVLVSDILHTPPYLRISRMIRDISAHDIVAGNKKANLRQMVEERIETSGETVREIRYREISMDETDPDSLSLHTLSYRTTVTEEHFLQWVTTDNRIVGFLRLSLPDPAYVLKHRATLPVDIGEAMIREVHIYGQVAELSKPIQEARSSAGSQHLGLGRQLIDEAMRIARIRGYIKVNVISSVGTREYYRNLGFTDCGLYQQKVIGGTDEQLSYEQGEP